MAEIANWTAGSVILKKNDTADSLMILLKGTVERVVGEASLTLLPGSILGIGVSPDEGYDSDYVAVTACSTYACPYSRDNDLDSVFKEYPKLAPVMTQQAVRNTCNLYDALLELIDSARVMYRDLISRLDSYPDMCRRTGDQIKDYQALRTFPGPVEDTGIEEWKVRLLKSLMTLEGRKDELLAGRIDLSASLADLAVLFINEVRKRIGEVESYKEKLKEASAGFLVEYSALKSKLSSITNGKGEDMSSLTGIFDRIVVYSELSPEDTADIRSAMREYKSIKDRYGISDQIRKIRRHLSSAFYPLYEAVLVKAIKEKEMPVYVRTFLMFGLLDEELLTKEELRTLYGFASSYRPDPRGHVMCAYEWLARVYRMQAEPSRNEFDMDYQAYLKDQLHSGDITEELYKKLLVSGRNRLHFEISNLFTIGNRMTFGRISAFEPVFDDVNVIGSMEKGYLHADKVYKELAEITDRDYSIFYRNDIYSDPERNITQLPVHKQFLPNFILMPVMGSRFALWQEIEGKRRQSEARMLLPIIMSEDISSAMTRLCGEFRWEMCKTEQGIHWNDMRDPSLTAEYTDYLQFYRKNSQITADIKERIKNELKKYNNNFKAVFVADYSDYIRFESNGSLRLLKIPREILAKYAPFSGRSKELLKENPQYKQFIERFNNHEARDRRIIALTLKRFEKEGIESPKELVDEYNYLSH
ncbi:MAG: hypothetical protein SPL57_03370 [Lachnospiraceae bacterium]|nr:hypothetical protein [Lachnospiraceae bacterium]